MRTATILLCLATLCLAPACPPAPAPPEPPFVIVDAAPTPRQDASPGAEDCDAACARANALGCPEAADVGVCAATCRSAHGVVADLAPGCVARCSSAAGVRACSRSWKCR